MKGLRYLVLITGIFCSIHGFFTRGHNLVMENRIDESETVVYKFGRHRPTPLILTMNGTVIYKIDNGNVLVNKKSIQARVKNNKITIRYDRNVKGRTGGKIYTFSVDSKIRKLELRFSWRERPRISLVALVNGEEQYMEVVDTVVDEFHDA